MRICFYCDLSAHRNWREVLEKVEFYRVDIRLLRELGHEVVLSGNLRSLDLHADLYYCWWWGRSIPALLLSQMRKKPCIITGALTYSTGRSEIPGLCYLDRPFWQKIILWITLKYSSKNLFISHYEYDEVTRNLPVNDPIEAPLAIDTDFYKPFEDKCIQEDFFFTLLWTSKSNVVRKGLIATLDGFSIHVKKFPSSNLIIAGKNGDYYDSLVDYVEKLGISNQVSFLGMISEHKKLELYRTCVAYIQPTLYEGFGHAIGEALSSGARVVSCRRGAVPEVLGSYGIYVEPTDAKAISSAMDMLANNPQNSQTAWRQHDWVSEHFSLDSRRRILAATIESLQASRD
jgi:glycosyltransferase involved in cell wall biosynthesis